MKFSIGSKVRLINSFKQAIRSIYVVCGKKIVDGSVATVIDFDGYFYIVLLDDPQYGSTHQYHLGPHNIRYNGIWYWKKEDIQEICSVKYKIV